MRLQQERSSLRHRQFLVPVVQQPGIVDDEFVVQENGDAFADVDDAELIPLPGRFVGLDERVAARRADRVVPQATAPHGLVEFVVWVGLFRIPDLDLRHRLRVDAAIDRRGDLVLDEQFVVAVFLFAGQVSALPLVDQFAAVDRPILLQVFGPGGELLLPFLGGQLGEVERAAAFLVDRPALEVGEVLAVEQGGEPLRRLGIGGGGHRKAQRERGQREGRAGNEAGHARVPRTKMKRGKNRLPHVGGGLS